MISGLFLGIFWPSAKFETRPYPAKTNNNSKRYIIAAIQFFKNFFSYISHKNWSWKLLAVIFGQQPAKHNIFARRLGRHVQGALRSWFTWLLELEVTCIDLGDVWFRSHIAKLKCGSHSLIGMCFCHPLACMYNPFVIVNFFVNFYQNLDSIFWAILLWLTIL
jgi:hypothetical protein